MTNCSLCDLPIGSDPYRASDVDGEFCCRGCLVVAQSLDDVDAVDAPQDVAPDTTSNEEFDGETAFLHVEGMHCSTCEAFLEATGTDHDGVERVEASYATDTLRVDYDPDRVSETDLPDLLSVAGYTASDRADPEPDGDDADVVRFLVGGGFFGMMAMLWYVLFLYPTYFGYDPLFDLGGMDGRYLFAQIWVFSSIVLFYTGYPILRGAYVSLRARQPNMDLLVSLAAVGSYSYSTIAMAVGRTDLYFDVTIAVILVVVAGTRYESRIKERATGALAAVTGSRERTVRRASGEEISTEDVGPRDELLVRPGERVPFDGTVVEGTAGVDEALMTGESIPVTKSEGDEVRGGTVVTDAPIVVEVGEAVSSTLDTLVRLLWDIQSSRSGVQRLVDRLATVFVPLVLALAFAASTALLATGSSPTTAALVGLTVVIVSCPCALGLAIPLAVAAGIRDAAARGIVVVSDGVFEDASDVDTVVFDKTGTLTDGDMRVLDVVTDDVSERHVLRHAAALERSSPHPIAEAIVEAADDAGTPSPRGTQNEFRADGGIGSERVEPLGGPSSGPDEVAVLDRGVRGTVDGSRTLVGHRSLFDGPEWTVPTDLRATARDAERRGSVPVFVGRDGVVEGVIAVGDDVRDEWASVVSELSAAGRDVVVLTGDSVAAARRFEEHPAVDEVFAEVPPEAKAETVRRIGADGTVAMVGDGSNDAPALAAADLGVSIASGTDVAADAADAVLLEDRLDAIPELFEITRGTNRRIKQNLGWAFVYNAVAIPLALFGLLNPLLAALAMATSSLLVVTNSARSVFDGA